MNPSDLGNGLKFFVFLDLFDDSEGTSFSGMALRPYSGIAIVTCLIEGSMRYEDTSEATGILPEGGVEWKNSARSKPFRDTDPPSLLLGKYGGLSSPGTVLNDVPVRVGC